MADFTPGPFHYRDDRTIIDISGTPIARCYADRNEAGNGPLFAAAPDLLSAVQAFLEITANPAPRADDRVIQWISVSMKARAAINKALGQ